VHVGFITAAIFIYTLTLSPYALQAVGFYFMVYVAAMLLILYCIIEINPPDASLSSLRDSYGRQPAVAVFLVLGFASLAGLPPLGGFLAKFFVFYNCLLLQVWGLISVLILASLLAICYYLRVIFGLFGRYGSAGFLPITVVPQPPLSTRVFTGFLVAVIIFLGIAQGPLSLLIK
jgi:NADH-quinone oxidoreductase subunit N